MPGWAIESPRRRALRRLVLGGGIAFAPALARSDQQPTLRRVRIGASEIELQLASGFEPALIDEITRWAERAAGAVALYLGRFPLAHVELLIQLASGAGVRGGTTFAAPEPYVRVRVGTETTPAQLRADWVLVHEMIHLALPRVARAHNWLHEGVATYGEGIARVRAGLLDAGAMWASLVAGVPNGQPKDGDRGLDHTPSWGRTYWGGALFCLRGDVRIRQRSGLKLGLQQALQGVLAAGGSYAQAWPPARILAVADAAVAQDTLTALYDECKDQPVTVDLDALWRSLGIRATGPESAEFDDRAELAAVRRAILS